MSWQELPRIGRSCQELQKPQEVVRSWQELPRTVRAAKSRQEQQGAAVSCQELPRAVRNCKEVQGVAKTCQELSRAISGPNGTRRNDKVKGNLYFGCRANGNRRGSDGQCFRAIARGACSLRRGIG